MEATEAGIVAAFPALEPAVGRHRLLLDRTAAWGVPPHVTVLYPFVVPDRIDNDIVARAASVVAGLPAIDVSFRRSAWFDERVVYLVPEPQDWFREATYALHGEFPDHPPYGGAYDDVVPHLTIGEDADRFVMRQAAADVQRALPITQRVESLLLMTGTRAPNTWRVEATLPLAGAADEKERPVVQ